MRAVLATAVEAAGTVATGGLVVTALEPPVTPATEEVGADVGGSDEHPPMSTSTSTRTAPIAALQRSGRQRGVATCFTARVWHPDRQERGRPRTRSPRMLRITFDVPPMIV